MGALSVGRSGCLHGRQREAALRGLVELPLAPFEWASRTQFFVADGLIVQASLQGDETFVFVRALDAGRMKWLDRLRVDWIEMRGSELRTSDKR